MTQHITQEQVCTLWIESTSRTTDSFALYTELCNAAIQHYIDQQAKELPVLPDTKHAKEWQHDMYTADQLQAYGQKCAAHAREVALSEVMDCYSPDDTYQDWADKINKMKAGK